MELIANASPVRQFLAYLDHIGVDERTLRVGHIDPRLRKSSAPIRISARLLFELMEAAAEKADMPDLGLQFAEWSNPRGFDAVSLLWEQSASLSEWYELAQRYIHLENNAIQYNIARGHHEIALIHHLLPILRARSTQFMYAFLALTVRVCRSVFGPTWNPVRVEFFNPRPPLVTAHRRFFRCDLRFGEERSAVIVRPEDFERTLPHANAEMLSYIRKDLERQSVYWSADIKDQVAKIILSDIAGKAPSLARVASMLAMSSRTLQRRLMQEGTDFGVILKSVRREIVVDRLAQPTPPPLAQLAFELGLSEASAASRFIRSELGYSYRDRVRVIRDSHPKKPLTL